MCESKEYRKAVKMKKGKLRNLKFKDLNKTYGLTEYSLHSYVKSMQHHFRENIDSFTAQKIATRCFDAFQKFMLHQSDRVYFKKYNEMNSVEGKSNTSGIRFKNNKLLWNGLEIDVVIDKNDLYVQEALALDKIKYCRILRKLVRGEYKFYIQLIMDGIHPSKINKDTGGIKNSIGTGNVGIDMGVQTIAISSKNEVKLLELCPEIDDIETQKLILQRKLDRQRRANNPNNYNDDGTIKNGIMVKDKRQKLIWIKSKRYIKTQNLLSEIYRKQACIRKQSHEKLANYIISLGDRILVETMNYKGLQARSKKTEKNENGKFKRKKRFGKSLTNKAPSMFLTILDNKLNCYNKELLRINTTEVKASQYNHITDEYNKKELSERWNDFHGFKIQRDVYSAFLIMNVKDNLREIDRSLCFNEFDNFKILHNREIERFKNSKDKKISSMGI